MKRAEAEELVEAYFDNCHYIMFGDYDLSRKDRRAKAKEWYLDLAVAIGIVELDRPQDDDRVDDPGVRGCHCEVCQDLRAEVQHQPDEEGFIDAPRVRIQLTCGIWLTVPWARRWNSLQHCPEHGGTETTHGFDFSSQTEKVQRWIREQMF